MRAAVVYESLFGNTKLIAEAVAEGLRSADPSAEVDVLPVADATPEVTANVSLLVVGAPTHYTRMSSPRSRRQYTAGRGVREWLTDLPEGPVEIPAAAFDTRLPSFFAGSAARPIARQLRQHGYVLAAKPAGFVVEKAKGPLRGGEEERARAWGARLAHQLAA